MTLYHVALMGATTRAGESLRTRATKLVCKRALGRHRTPASCASIACQPPPVFRGISRVRGNLELLAGPRDFGQLWKLGRRWRRGGSSRRRLPDLVTLSRCARSSEESGPKWVTCGTPRLPVRGPGNTRASAPVGRRSGKGLSGHRPTPTTAIAVPDCCHLTAHSRAQGAQVNGDRF